ncbi:MAG TPA: molybdopterin cofactor-binding domain-containing protein [Gaiellaceae bacterium]|nr:molybdopterin cofactor-binding domain-containing protein [Gaiellaceae bacterium]
MAAIGEAVLRKEDARLLTGQGRYVDNLRTAGTLHAVVVRSPYAHARIDRVDVSAALAADGVVAAFTGADLADAWPGGLPCFWPVSDDIKMPTHLPLATDKARFAGDGVAVVVAESRAQAKDAAELVTVDYQPLPAVTDVERALAPNAPLVHDDVPGNRCFTWSLVTGEPERVFAEADVTVSCRFRQQRLIPAAMEPRGTLCEISAAGDVVVTTSTQAPHILRTAFSLVLGIPEAKIRVIAPDVGGGFGSKVEVYAEDMIVIALARKLGRPVKWTEERSEGCLATIHGRDVVQEIELAATSDGKIRAVRTRLKAAMGAYLQAVTPGVPLLGAWLYAGCYDVDAYDFHCTGVFTTTTPTDAYRGAGRPEATYAIERAIDALARKLGRDPVEIRRLNFIDEFPADIASGLQIDSGDYHAALDRALELIGYEEVRREQAERRSRGDVKQLGIGLSTYVEMCGLAPSRILGALKYGAGGWESLSVRVLPTGTVQVMSGTTPHGQGHATTFSQIVADRLGVDVADVEFLAGDTAVVPTGMDTYGSRSLPVGGVALYHATDKVIAKARRIVAHQLEASEDDLEYEAGRFSVKGSPDKAMTVKEAAFAAWAAHNLPDGLEPGLEATHVYDPPNFSWPAGCHIAVVDVDTETGEVELTRYVAVDDVGTVINPMIVDGQVHGGIAQGVAQALWEEAVYDEDGNLVTGSLLNYLVPSAAELPSFVLDRTVTPSPTNPLGVKGVGETGTIASTPAVVNAVLDALSHLGVTDIDMPTTPERVWRAIQEASASAADQGGER